MNETGATRAFIAALLLFILPGSAVGCWRGLLAVLAEPEMRNAVLCGLALGVLLYRAALRRWHWFLVFDHELAHALVAIFFFRRIHRFIVTGDRGGLVNHSGGGGFGNIMITMAPYYLPTFTLLAVLLRSVTPNTWFPYYDAIIGFALSFHTLSTFDETRRNWTGEKFLLVDGYSISRTDIARTGFGLAALFIVALTLNIHGLCFWMMAQGDVSIFPYYGTVYLVGADFWSGLWEWGITKFR